MRSTDQASCLLKKRSGQKASRSQGLVEFAVALPILLMLLFAILDFSLLFSAWLVSQNIARQAVRYAVTGEYNTAYCSEGCEEVWDQDAARLLSIRDEAERFIPGLMVDSAATTQVDPGYLQITICSSRDITGDDVSDFVTILGRMGSAQYSECQPTQDAGGPGDTVVVMVDFNHPYLTPFLNQIWPMIHLTSAHRGVVEQFRVSRLINLPPQILLPSATPTITFTPSKTSTPTKTFTPTDTFTPSNTGTATFTPTITKTRTPTNTRTITNTPTITRTPTLNCSQFSLGDFSLTYWYGRPSLTIYISNNSSQDTWITGLTFDWAAYDAENPYQQLDWMRYNSTTLTGSNDYSSPSSWSAYGYSSSYNLNAGNNRPFEFRYYRSDNPIGVAVSTFGLTVTLDNGCTVTRNATQPTAPNTPTVPTSTFTRTYTRTNTVPTGTFTHTYTPSNTVPTSTFTRTYTRTNTSVSAPTKTFTPSRTPSPTNTLCISCYGWEPDGGKPETPSGSVTMASVGFLVLLGSLLGISGISHRKDDFS